MAKIIALALVAMSAALCVAQSALLSDLQVADIAKSICKHAKGKIEELKSVSSMLQLVDFFENGLQDEACRDRWLGSFQYLKVVLTVGNSNACSDEKISALEEFNRRYVSTTSEDKHSQKKEHLKAPKAIKMFFIHYAYLVSSVCKDRLAATIQQSDLRFAGADGNPVDMTQFDSITATFTSTFAVDIEKNGFEDIILPWKMIDQHHLRAHERKFLPAAMDLTHATKTKLPVRISLRVSAPIALQVIQKSCLTNLKPAYSKLVLPALRLINLGLYQDNEQLASLLASDEVTQRLFKVALLCETLLPVEVFEDKSMARGKVTAITPEKATQLRQDQPTLQSTGLEFQAGEEPAPAEYSLAGTDEISTLVDFSAAKQLSRTLKANRIKQEGIIGRFYKISKSMVKSKIKTKVGQLFTLNSPDDANSITELELEENATGLVRRRRFDPFQIAAIGTVAFVVTVLFVIYLGPLICKLISYGIVYLVKGAAWPFIRVFGSKKTYDSWYTSWIPIEWKQAS